MSRKYNTLLLNLFLQFFERFTVFFGTIFRSNLAFSKLGTLPWATTLVFLFAFSLSLAPDSQVQFSNLTSQRINLSQRQYGLVLFSPSNFLLIPLIFILFRQLVLKKSGFMIYKFEVILLIYLVIIELSAIFSTDIRASLVSLVKIFFAFTIYFIFSRLSLSPKQLFLVIFALVVTIYLETILALIQYLRGGLTGFLLESAGRYSSSLEEVAKPGLQQAYFRAIGTFAHPNTLSNYLGMLIPVSFILITLKNNFIRVIGILGVIFCISVSFLAFSRWGIITNFFTLFIAVLLILKSKDLPKISVNISHWIKLVLIGVFSFCLFVLNNQFFIQRFFIDPDEDRSLQIRLALISQSLRMIQDNPILGVGIGGSLNYFSNYDYTQNNISLIFLAPVHNFYLLIVTEAGIFALITLTLATTAFIFHYKKNISNLLADNKIICRLLSLSLLTFFFNGIWTMRTFEDRVGFLFMLIFGLLVNILNSKLPISHFS